MKNCPKCEAEVNDGDNFCGGCGYNLSIQMQSNTIFMQKDLNATDMRYKLGEVYFKQGKYDMAIKNFEKVLQDRPENTVAKEMLDKALSARKRLTTTF